MVEEAVTQNTIVDHARLKAGAEYIYALEQIGFLIDAALWTVAAKRSSDNPDLQLTIVSRLVERGGTGEIYRLLFLAYEKAKTPQNFDPWIVNLYGQRSQFAQSLKEQPEVSGTASLNILGVDGVPREEEAPVWQMILDRLTRPEWIYRRQFRKPSFQTDTVAYKRFKHQVEKAAA